MQRKQPGVVGGGNSDEHHILCGMHFAFYRRCHSTVEELKAGTVGDSS